MNVVILLLLLANAAGIYYGYHGHPARPSQYPSANNAPLPEGVALLPLYQNLHTAPDTEVVLSLDTSGWGDDSIAQAAKIAEQNAWDAAENNTGTSATVGDEAPQTLAIDDSATQVANVPESDVWGGIEENTNIVTSLPDKAAQTLADKGAEPADMPQNLADSSQQAPDSPAFELSLPAFAQIETVEKIQVTLDSSALEASPQLTSELVSNDAAYAQSSSHTMEILASHNTSDKLLDNSKIIITADIANAIAKGLEERLSLPPVDFSTNTTVASAPKPTIATPPRSIKPDASNLVFALAGNGNLAHLQTNIPTTTPEVAEIGSLSATVEPADAPAPEPIVEKLVWQCYRTGFFPEETAAKHALAWWQNKTDRVELVEDAQVEQGSTQLYLPAFASKAEARLAMAHLKQVGIDHFLLDNPKYAIAVGTFNSPENAQKQRDKLKKYGYRQVEEKKQNSSKARYHLRLQLNQQQQAWLNLFSQSQQLLLPEKTSICPRWQQQE